MHLFALLMYSDLYIRQHFHNFVKIYGNNINGTQAIFYNEPQPSPDLSLKHKENDMIDKSWVKDLLKKKLPVYCLLNPVGSDISSKIQKIYRNGPPAIY